MAERLFISHASEDEAVVSRIVAYLEAHGTSCWLASRDIPAKSIYADEIAGAMEGCSACAVILSAASNQSKAVKRELELASHYDKPFIPIRIDATQPGRGFDYYLRNAQWVDFRRDGERGLDRIVGPTIQNAPHSPSPLANTTTGQLVDEKKEKKDAAANLVILLAAFLLGTALLVWLLMSLQSNPG